MAETNPQDRIAELELQLEEANKKLAAAEKANTELTQQLEASRNDVSIQVKARAEDSDVFDKQYSELQKELAAAKEANAELLERVAGAETEIKVLSVKAKGAVEKTTVEHEGKVFEIISGATLPVDGTYQKLSAKDIAASPEIVKMLVEKGSGILREVK